MARMSRDEKNAKQRARYANDPLKYREMSRLSRQRHHAQRLEDARAKWQSAKAPTVYVYYDADDRPIYVGKTINFPDRNKGHRYKSPWYHLVRRTETRAVSSAEEMHLLEAQLIAELNPPFNKDGRFLSRQENLEIPPSPQLSLWASGVAAP